jgi:hypothetical protein
MRPEFEPPELTPTDMPPIEIVGGFTGTGSVGMGTLTVVCPPLGVPTVGGAGSEPLGAVTGRLGKHGAGPPADASGNDGREGVVEPLDPPTAAAIPSSTGLRPPAPCPEIGSSAQVRRHPGHVGDDATERGHEPVERAGGCPAGSRGCPGCW